jgi:hypothetical protein
VTVCVTDSQIYTDLDGRKRTNGRSYAGVEGSSSSPSLSTKCFKVLTEHIGNDLFRAHG